MMMKQRVKWKWVVLWSLWAARLAREALPPRRVSGGALRGERSRDGSVASYRAVPYATVNHQNRFQAPGPEPKWDGIYDAVDEHIHCLQRFDTTNIVTGQVDCLVLNVYTPLDVPEDARLPVMVYIHGGGFFSGSNSPFLYGPEYLVTKGIVLVTLNYRVNIQGFLCLGIKEAPGNAGMKDQVAALKWVQRNIRVFGGDPDNVTLFGESAGAVSVSYHILSPMSKGLFHKVITQSGSSLGSWAHQFRPLYMASLLAKVMGYSSQEPKELYDIFNSKSEEELIVTRVTRKKGTVCVSEILYNPCVEQKVENEEAFLTDSPWNILVSGEFNKVPMIIGTNSEEGLFFAARENKTMLANFEFEKALPRDLVFNSEDERKAVADTLRNLYMGEDDISSDTILKLSKFHGEAFFNYPSLEETELILRTTDKPIFNYLFNYSSIRNVAKRTLGSPFSLVHGATHADELFYLFNQFWLPSFFENKMIEKMTTLWTNFAKYGDPTPPSSTVLPLRWNPTDARAPQALVLDAQTSTIPLFHSTSLVYWRQVYAKHRRKY